MLKNMGCRFSFMGGFGQNPPSRRGNFHLPVDRPLAQPVDSFRSSFNCALSFAVPWISPIREPRQWGGTPEQDEGGLRHDCAGHQICSKEIMQDHQRQSPPAH
jgi:hypothetical protein